MSADLLFTKALSPEDALLNKGWPLPIPLSEDFNVTGSNACRILSALGLPTDFYNSDPIPVREFEAALFRFQKSEIASLLDTGVAPFQRGNVIHCGVAEGYLTRQVARMLALVSEAIQKGATHACFY